MSKVDLEYLPEPGNKYKVVLKLGGGTGGEVHEAVESLTGKIVAIKMIELKKEMEKEIKREYYVLKELSAHENFPEFYGIFLKKENNIQKVWLVIEFCEGGTAVDLARKLEQENRKMSEIHIAYIMRETIKAIIYLHENDTSHRDIRGSNILLTGEGRVKLIDFGISTRVEKNMKMHTCKGSPSWMAPEVIRACQKEDESFGYDKKADVWAIGITAIELGDGQAPFEDMHPGRALFQIVQNPQPTLRKPTDWSQVFNDFISECLVKNPENRPCAQELLSHTFFEPLVKEENLLDDMKDLLNNYKSVNLQKKPEIQIRNGYMAIGQHTVLEKILQEDLAALADITEDSVLSELYERLKTNEFHTFIGDILVILNPNQYLDIYGLQHHKKYRFKAKSQNAPHIYATAESAYRDVFHHEKCQNILFAGETGSGKTANMIHVVDHLLFLGQGLKSSEKITKALNVIHAMGNASTPHNHNSTRHILQTQLTFTDTGKMSGAVFKLYLLEKERVTTTAKKQANFHLFYQFYDAIESEDKLADFYLKKNTQYKFLKSGFGSFEDRNSKENIAQYKLFEKNLIDLEFEEEQINAIENILAAILLIGEIEFIDDDGNAVIASPEIIQNVAELLKVDNKKLSWALLNYCLILKGKAIMRHNSKQEAEEAKNVFARGMYSRLVDWIVNKINEKLSVSRIIYGDKYIISLLDFYGFECYKKNTLNQLFVNTINEELQFHYNQKIFAWDKQIAEEEGVSISHLEFLDNKEVLQQIMSKQDGLLYKIDEATKTQDSTILFEGLQNSKNAPIFAENAREFSIYHYTGKITYDASEMPEKNRDFLPPEIIETMRLSTQQLTKELFSSLLSKSGNLSKEFGKQFGAANPVMIDKKKNEEKNVNTTPVGQFSQTRQMRTAVTTFRGACNDIFKNLKISEFGFHYVRCIRTELSDKPGTFNPEIVRQQLRALAVVHSALTIQKGYSYSVSHEEFIRRYKFLAFDFDENVEETKENCRLLLLRLNLEGWTMGKTKVFLKYYNKEYLSRLYEAQIKKIIKVQSMMRAFMTRRKLYAKIKRYQADADKNKDIKKETNEALEAKAAALIQRRYREHAASKYNLTEKQKEFIRPWCQRWRTKSIFQILLLYRSERLQTIVNFCLQVHINNQNFINDNRKINARINLDSVTLEANPREYLPPLKPTIPKLLFMWESLKLRGDVNNSEKLPDFDVEQLESEIIDKIIRKRATISEDITEQKYKDKEIQTSLNGKNNSWQSNDFATTDSIKTQTAENIRSAVENKELHNETIQKENRFERIAKEQKEQKSELEESNQLLSNTDQTAFLNIMIIKNALDNLRRNDDDSSSRENYTDNFQETRVRALQSQPSSKKISKKPEIKINPEQKLRNSINEMEEKFRNPSYVENGDNPPFNFKAMLKKTNYVRDVQKPPDGNMIYHDEINTSLKTRKKPLGFAKFDEVHYKPQTVSVELAPGILIHGKITDL